MAIETRLTKFLNKKKWIIPVLFGMICVYLVGTIAAWQIRGFENLNPNFAFSIGGELCAIIVALMITISLLPTYKRQSGYIRIFVTLLTIGCSCCFLDSLQMLVDGVENLGQANRVLAILVFTNETFFFYFFWLFATYALGGNGKTMRIINTIALIAGAIFVLLPLVNFFYPLYFTISPEGVYARNRDTWWICRIYLTMMVIFVTFAIIFSKETRKKRLVILFFMLIPLIGMGIGGYKYGTSILYAAMLVSLVMIYSFLFSDNEKALYSTNKELGLATNIQKHMLPSIFPAFPDRKEFDIYALMDPAKEVGGDFYDFFLIDDYHLGIVIADVSDKGVPAALFMMASKIMVQNYALIGYSPKEVLARVNKQICSNNQEEMFVTIWLGVLDLRTGVLTATNAGHERPIIKHPNGEYEIMRDKHGFVVGWISESVYTEYQIKLEKGSKLFVYTDGVPEARNVNEQFGMERTLNALNTYKDLSVTETCQNLLMDIYKFMGNNKQFDDITMLCLEYRGLEDDEHQIKIEADVNKIGTALDQIVGFLKENEVDNKLVYKIQVAVEEALANVASYAYDEPGKGTIEIQYKFNKSPKAVVITIIDEGKPFNPLEREDPDTTLSVEDRQIGGLGIFIVKKTMDDVKYIRKNDKNILIMKKNV